MYRSNHGFEEIQSLETNFRYSSMTDHGLEKKLLFGNDL